MQIFGKTVSGKITNFYSEKDLTLAEKNVEKRKVMGRHK
jgi:hypothetical protein